MKRMNVRMQEHNLKARFYGYWHINYEAYAKSKAHSHKKQVL